jgi:hypothetical protein
LNFVQLFFLSVLSLPLTLKPNNLDGCKKACLSRFQPCLPSSFLTSQQKHSKTY